MAASNSAAATVGGCRVSSDCHAAEPLALAPLSERSAGERSDTRDNRENLAYRCAHAGYDFAFLLTL